MKDGLRLQMRSGGGWIRSAQASASSSGRASIISEVPTGATRGEKVRFLPILKSSVAQMTRLRISV